MISGISQWVEDRLTGFKVVSGTVLLLSLYTFVYNCVRVDENPPLHTFWALVQSGIGVGVFGAGLRWERQWLKNVQLALMLIVSFTTLNFNTDPWMGLRFLFITLVVAYAYDVFDSLPGWKVLSALTISYLGILVVYKDPVKSLITWLNFTLESSLLGYILWDKVRRWKGAYVEAHSIARESLDLLKETTNEPRDR